MSHNSSSFCASLPQGTFIFQTFSWGFYYYSVWLVSKQVGASLKDTWTGLVTFGVQEKSFSPPSSWHSDAENKSQKASINKRTKTEEVESCCYHSVKVVLKILHLQPRFFPPRLISNILFCWILFSTPGQVHSIVTLTEAGIAVTFHSLDKTENHIILCFCCPAKLKFTINSVKKKKLPVNLMSLSADSQSFFFHCLVC